jgi:hypothetical protein
MKRALLLLLIVGGLLGTQSIRADKRIGISPPNYDLVEVTPHSTFSGGFTVFNQGDEDLSIYAEARNAPGNVTFKWQYEVNDWRETAEILVPAKTHAYGMYIVHLGALTQGAWYNWSIVCGYIETDPKVSVVAQAGFRINMIWSSPPLKWYQKSSVQLAFFAILGASFALGVIIKQVRKFNKREPWHVLQKN